MRVYSLLILREQRHSFLLSRSSNFLDQTVQKMSMSKMKSRMLLFKHSDLLPQPATIFGIR